MLALPRVLLLGGGEPKMHTASSQARLRPPRTAGPDLDLALRGALTGRAAAALRQHHPQPASAGATPPRRRQIHPATSDRACRSKLPSPSYRADSSIIHTRYLRARGNPRSWPSSSGSCSFDCSRNDDVNGACVPHRYLATYHFAAPDRHRSHSARTAVARASPAWHVDRACPGCPSVSMHVPVPRQQGERGFRVDDGLAVRNRGLTCSCAPRVGPSSAVEPAGYGVGGEGCKGGCCGRACDGASRGMRGIRSFTSLMTAAAKRVAMLWMIHLVAEQSCKHSLWRFCL